MHRRITLGILAFGALAAPACAQPSPDSVAAAMSRILALATFGAVSVEPARISVTPEGDHYRVSLPLSGLSSPADAALTATAKPAPGGAWSIESLALPSTATAEPQGAALSYTIESQSITALVDPGLAHPSTWKAELGGIRLDNIKDQVHATQTLESYVAHGSLVAQPDQRLMIASEARARNWRMALDNRKGPPVDVRVRSADLDLSVAGLDQAKAESLRARLHDVTQGLSRHDSPVAQRTTLLALLDDVTGLMQHAEGHETFHDIGFSAGPAINGAAGQVAIAFSAGTADEDLEAHYDLSVDQLTLSAAPPAFAPYVPRHLALRQVAEGLPAPEVSALLRAALAPDADPAALRAQAAALLARPNARLGIDPFSLDLGPARASGSARLLATPGGDFLGRVHVTAQGVDMLLRNVISDPALKQFAPVLLMLKGMARQEGPSLVWDIETSAGGTTVNGMPVGQPPSGPGGAGQPPKPAGPGQPFPTPDRPDQPAARR